MGATHDRYANKRRCHLPAIGEQQYGQGVFPRNCTAIICCGNLREGGEGITLDVSGTRLWIVLPRECSGILPGAFYRSRVRSNAFREFDPAPVVVRPRMTETGMKKSLRHDASTRRSELGTALSLLSGNASARSGPLCPGAAGANPGFPWGKCSRRWFFIS